MYISRRLIVIIQKRKEISIYIFEYSVQFFVLGLQQIFYMISKGLCDQISGPSYSSIQLKHIGLQTLLAF
jgi:hypothetical protein